MTRIEEQNAIRTAARNEVLPRFEAAFPEAVRIPGTSLYYLKGTNEWLTVEVKVPTINGRTHNGNGDKFDLNTVIEKANTELAEKEAKRLERESRPKKSTEPIDHTDFDNEVWAKLVSTTEPTELKTFFTNNEWDDGITQQKVMSALRRLREDGRVESLDGEKNKKLWKVAF